MQIDVVYIGTIHPTHLYAAQLMLQCGKPVLCEKPLTMNIQDTASLIEKANKSGVFLMEVTTFYLYACMWIIRVANHCETWSVSQWVSRNTTIVILGRMRKPDFSSNELI